MQFTSMGFLIFFPAVLLVYFLIPRKLRILWSLIASTLFYMSFSPKMVLILYFSITVSYLAGIQIEKKPGKKYIAFSGIGIILAMLSVFKCVSPSIGIPLGISYFTLQELGYLADIYKGKIKAERNYLQYALYVSFFPKIFMGPIEEPEAFLKQLKEVEEKKLWDTERIWQGIVLMSWGYFQKLVIADRIAIFVNEIYDNYMDFGTVELLFGSVGYSFQLYADFAGCMCMVMGMAKIMGISLTENFNAPVFAKSVKEFWGSRWHVSLGRWLRKYVYIPLGGNRNGYGRKLLNLFITFFVSGLWHGNVWHGSGWHYLVWGGLVGVCQVTEELLEPVVNRFHKKFHTRTDSFSYRGMQHIKCWLLFAFTLIWLRAPTSYVGFHYFYRMLTKWNPWVLFDDSLYQLGVSQKNMHLLLVFIVILILVDYIRYKKNETVDVWLSGQCIWFQWGVVLAFILGAIILGAYGAAYQAENFIYFQF